MAEMLVHIPLLTTDVLIWEWKLKLLRMKFVEEGTEEQPVFIHVFFPFVRLEEARQFLSDFGEKKLSETEQWCPNTPFTSHDKRFLYQHVLYYLLRQRHPAEPHQHLVLLPDILRSYEPELTKRKFQPAIYHGTKMLSKHI